MTFFYGFYDHLFPSLTTAFRLASPFDPSTEKWFKNGIQVGNFSKFVKTPFLTNFDANLHHQQFTKCPNQEKFWCNDVGACQGCLKIVILAQIPNWLRTTFAWAEIYVTLFFCLHPSRPRSEASITVFGTVVPSKLTELWLFCRGNSVFRSYFWPHQI